MEKQQYSGHVMKINAACAVPRYIVAVDTETLPHKCHENVNRVWHKFRLGCAISCRYESEKASRIKRVDFTDTRVFWRYLYDLTGDRHTVWVVAHNALFDLVALGMHNEFLKSRLVLDRPRSKRQRENNDEDDPHCYCLCCLDSPPTIIAARHPETQGRIIFVDTMNWFKAPLKDLGEALSMPKMQMPDFTECDRTWKDYCYRDTEIVFHTFVQLLQWVRKNDMGNFRYTAAGQALNAYRHRFMTEKIYVHDNMEVKEIERNGYFGGRIDVFRMGEIKQHCVQLDVNGLFPSIMSYEMLPVRMIRSDIRCDYLTLMPDINWASCVAEVELQTKHHDYPYRGELVTCYPTGHFRTTLCGEELYIAHRRGDIVSVKSWAEYECKQIFAEYVRELYGMRKEYESCGNMLYAQFAKSLLNSLYGKFGQRSQEWIPCEYDLSAEPWSSWPVTNMADGSTEYYRSVGWQVFRMAKEREMKSTMVAIPAFITSAARCRMNRLMEIAGAKNVYYIGVDGLIVNSTGYDNLDHRDEIVCGQLGKLREVDAADHCQIFGCADYKIGCKVVLSGRSGRLTNIESGQMLSRHFHAKSQLFAGGNNNAIPEETTPWNRATEYKKGCVQPDGYVLPLVFG